MKVYHKRDLNRYLLPQLNVVGEYSFFGNFILFPLKT